MAEIALAEPFSFIFDPETTALIVIDMQRDFIDPGGFGEALGNNVSRLQRIIPATAQLVAIARGLDAVFILANAMRQICLIVHQANALGAAYLDWRSRPHG